MKIVNELEKGNSEIIEKINNPEVILETNKIILD